MGYRTQTYGLNTNAFERRIFELLDFSRVVDLSFFSVLSDFSANQVAKSSIFRKKSQLGKSSDHNALHARPRKKSCQENPEFTPNDSFLHGKMTNLASQINPNYRGWILSKSQPGNTSLRSALPGDIPSYAPGESEPSGPSVVGAWMELNPGRNHLAALGASCFDRVCFLDGITSLRSALPV